LKKFAEKNYKNHLRRNNYEICTAVTRYFPNILDVVVLENINLSLDKIEQPPLTSNEKDMDFCHQSATCAVISVYSNHTSNAYHVDVIAVNRNKENFNSSNHEGTGGHQTFSRFLC
jgi:hypothetical protein